VVESIDTAMGGLPAVDLIVIVAYLGSIVGFGLWFAGRRGNSEDYMAAGRSLPGWAVGLSMFGSYVSSISFLANPGKAYAGNWNAFVFSLATPIAAWIAVKWFVPFYRRNGEVSAYEHLERRFGPWARSYAVVCFLLTQVARTGIVVYLLALAVSPLTGWRVETTILVTAVLMTFYTLAGGIKAVVWTGVLQSGVLLAGTLICIAAIVLQTPGQLDEIVRTGAAQDKFSLGSLGLSWAEPTFWVVFLYALAANMRNFGVDQSYVQRYITAHSDAEAAKSVWITTLLYVPVAAVFFFIGTGLFVFYTHQRDLLGSVVNADEVFPHFIATQLPVGMAGLGVAAILAAAMDSNLNSMATLTYGDLYKRYLRPNAGEQESMYVLLIATLLWGALSTVVALSMIHVRNKNALDVWWQLESLFSGLVLGLFLLGMMSRRAGSADAAVAVICGVAVILWMLISPTGLWPESWHAFRNPLHNLLTIVVGTITILSVGMVAGLRKSRRALDAQY
jgi:SSS family solute:Na+ symporter